FALAATSFLVLLLPPSPPLFPYTTLFRSYVSPILQSFHMRDVYILFWPFVAQIGTSFVELGVVSLVINYLPNVSTIVFYARAFFGVVYKKRQPTFQTTALV